MPSSGLSARFQFTPARGGRRGRRGALHGIRDVSIHARAWRATITISAVSSTLGFQFTPARGGRLNPFGYPSSHAVSIHARAWRATMRKTPCSSPTCFNSRPRVAGDLLSSFLAGVRYSFNSRPRVAGDCTPPRRSAPAGCFNSRPRVAGDRVGRPQGCSMQCFNSRPRVAGDKKYLSKGGSAEFQFTPARGGRPQKIVSFLFIEALQKACNADSIPFLPLIVCH